MVMSSLVFLLRLLVDVKIGTKFQKQILKMGFRILLLLAMGLGAMYMMHLLAQDYNRIRQPVQAATRFLSSASATLTRRKRELILTTKEKSSFSLPNSAQLQEKELKKHISNEQLQVDWKRILSRDHFECLQSLICQIMSGAEHASHEAILLIDFLEATLKVAPAKISRAFSRGLALRGLSERCYDEYPFCLYSAKTMFRVLRWFSDNTFNEQT